MIGQISLRAKPEWLAAALFALALCFVAPAQAQRHNPAYDDITEQGAALADCAGAVAAQGGLNPLEHPLSGSDGEWGVLLSGVLTRLHVEPGLQGMTGRYAASAARAYWAGRPRAARAAAAQRCRGHFGG